MRCCAVCLSAQNRIRRRCASPSAASNHRRTAGGVRIPLRHPDHRGVRVVGGILRRLGQSVHGPREIGAIIRELSQIAASAVVGRVNAAGEPILESTSRSPWVSLFGLAEERSARSGSVARSRTRPEAANRLEPSCSDTTEIESAPMISTNRPLYARCSS
jgi:hypothetical protein